MPAAGDWIEEAKRHLLGSDAIGAVTLAYEKVKLALTEINVVDHRNQQSDAAKAAADEAAADKGAAEKAEADRIAAEKAESERRKADEEGKKRAGATLPQPPSQPQPPATAGRHDGHRHAQPSFDCGRRGGVARDHVRDQTSAVTAQTAVTITATRNEDRASTTLTVTK